MLRLRSRRVPRQVRSSVRFICESIESRVLLAAVNWTGLGDGVNWTNAANWSSNPALPGPADDVTISVAANPTITLSSGTQSINSLVCDENLTISGGATTLTIAAASLLAATTALTNGTLSGAGDVTVTGTLNWSGGTMSGSGKTITASGATATLSGATLQLRRTFQNDGTVTWSNGDWLLTNGTINNNGALNIVTSSVLQCNAPSGTNSFNNASGAIVTKTGTGFVSFSGVAPVVFNNAGNVNVNEGEIKLHGGGASSAGTFNVAANARIEFGSGGYSMQSPIFSSGMLRFNGGGGAGALVTFSNAASTFGGEIEAFSSASVNAGTFLSPVLTLNFSSTT